MDFKIDDAVPTPAEQSAAKRALPTKPEKAAMKNYCEAYKDMYGVEIEIIFERPWFRIKGGVSVNIKRLHEMTRQLRYRRNV